MKQIRNDPLIPTNTHVPCTRLNQGSCRLAKGSEEGMVTFHRWVLYWRRSGVQKGFGLHKTRRDSSVHVSGIEDGNESGRSTSAGVSNIRSRCKRPRVWQTDVLDVRHVSPYQSFAKRSC